MPAGEPTASVFWGSIGTMPSINPLPGVTMWPAAGTNMMINFVRIEPGAEVPLHAHPHEQGGTVIEGIINMTIEGETRELRTGDVYLAPPHAVHGATAGPDGCLVVDIFSPPREDYIIPAE
ncbi:MAG: cupin domain-containing protein [Thermomicrobiales bacterium]|nr:cupin domain-containing protein [Thermomicrobiales bacterium]MCO5220100.1 cupin domain-containing protein [Thermomicrobiales bacterium]